MTIENAEDAQKLYEDIISALIRNTIKTILLTIEESVKDGEDKIKYYLDGRAEFHKSIIKELELRKFKVEYRNYTNGLSTSSAVLSISW